MDRLCTSVVVLHEYGEPKHVEPLRYLLGQTEGVIHCNLGFGRRLYWCIRGRRECGWAAMRKDLIELWNLLTRRGETVLCAFAPFGWVGGLLIFWLRQRHRVIYHSSWPYWKSSQVPRHRNNRLAESLWRRALKGLEAVGVTEAATQALQEFGVLARRIPHAVDCCQFRPRCKQSHEHRGGRILYVGRFVEEKGIPLILEAARRMHNLGLTWVFVGEGPLRNELEIARDQGANLEILGYLSGAALVAEYQSASIFVLPSVSVPNWEELFGISIIEAFACGTPVVATACIGPKDLIESGEDGFLVPQNDIEALCLSLEKLVSNGEQMCVMGRRARKKAEEMYDLPVVARQWAEFLMRKSEVRG